MTDRCNQKPSCDDPPVAKVYWPGREPALMCLRHSEWAKRIADAMGFHLVIEKFVPEVA